MQLRSSILDPSTRTRNRPVARFEGADSGDPGGISYDSGVPTGELEVIRSVVFDASPEDVWDSLVRPERLSRWLGGTVEIEVRPGGRGTLTRADGRIRRLRVEVVEPPRRLAFRWWPPEEPGSLRPGGATRVTFALDSAPGGVRLTILERPMPGPGLAVPGEDES